MDFEKVLQFATDNLSEYFSALTQTFFRPFSYFAPTSEFEALNSGLVTQRQPTATLKLSPKLISYALFSILLGITFHNQIPGVNPVSSDIGITLILIFSFWFLYGTIVHLICKVFRGSGSYIDGLSATLQVIASAYVISNFIALVFGIIVQVNFVASSVSRLGGLFKFFVAVPEAFYFVLQFIFLLAYLPIAMHKVHRFAWTKQLSISFVSFVLVLGFGITGIVGLSFLTYQQDLPATQPNPNL